MEQLKKNLQRIDKITHNTQNYIKINRKLYKND